MQVQILPVDKGYLPILFSTNYLTAAERGSNPNSGTFENL